MLAKEKKYYGIEPSKSIKIAMFRRPDGRRSVAHWGN